MPEALSFPQELKRKSIHIATAVIPISYFLWFSREQIFWLSVFLTIGFFTADILRMKFALAEKYFIRIFSPLLRSGELQRRFTGASYLFLGITITVAAFPKKVAVPAVLIAALADSLAALGGKLYGRHSLLDKTWEGTLTFAAVAAGLTGWFWGFGLKMFVVAIPTAAVELAGEKLNDNLTVPILSALLIQAVYL